MFKRLFAYTQYLLPQHIISVCMGKLANCTHPTIKNWMINQFIKKYAVNLDEAEFSEPKDYATFNDFFIRQLKPGARTITHGTQDIASPADGTLAEIGLIVNTKLIQAKNHDFTLQGLLGGDTEATSLFVDGHFATIYLAPHNYHRVHLPLDAKLVKTIYIPGQLFSVNHATATFIPNLYSRNERLVCIFESTAGPMAVIMVGAMIVGSIQTTWMDQPVRGNQVVIEQKALPLVFKKGDQLGYFKLGSTVIMLFAQNQIRWLDSMQSGSTVQVGELLGKSAE